jgi:cytidylate kinase
MTGGDLPEEGRRKRPIVAIDGPAAAGKSTVGRKVAASLGYTYIDTGALYRAVAWIANRRGITPERPAGLVGIIEKTDFRLGSGDEERRVFVDGRDISGEIRSEEMGRLASSLSALPEVREGLLHLQRQLGREGGVVMDGRDIGTVIFPDAEVKVFLSASEEERGRRRWLEMGEQGVHGSLEEVREELARRDDQDRSREHAPLRQAADAVPVDTTDLTPDGVADKIGALVGAWIAGNVSREGTPPAKAPTARTLKVAVLHRRLDRRFKENFPRDIEGREDEDYVDEIVTALRKRRHEVSVFAVREDALQELANLDCDLAFNLVEEGLNNNSSLEPHLPAILDVYGIPYTGGDFLSIALTADKARTKEILTYHEVPTPAFQLFESGREEVRPDLLFPLIVKPLREDAGIGIFRESVVNDHKSLRRQVRRTLRTYHQPALAEEYIHGRELSVAVFEHRGKLLVSPLSEVVFYSSPDKPRVYTYTAKWDDESTEYENVDPTECPAENIHPAVENEVRRLSARAFRALRLRGYGRVDFRLAADGRLYVFEVNVNPLIGEESLMAVLARKMGWYFPTFINNIAMEAYRRSRKEHRGLTLRDILRRESRGGDPPP